MSIKVRYRAVDGFSKTRSFKTLAGAQKFAQGYVGETPDLGSHYAVSGDGVGTVYVSGSYEVAGTVCLVTMLDLFPVLAKQDYLAAKQQDWASDVDYCY